MRKALLFLLLLAASANAQISIQRAGQNYLISDRIHYLDAISFLSPADSGAVLDTLNGIWENYALADADTMWLFREIFVPAYFTAIDSIQVWGFTESSIGIAILDLRAAANVSGSAYPSLSRMGTFGVGIIATDKWYETTLTSGTGTVTSLNSLFNSNIGGVITIALRRLGGHGGETLADTWHFKQIVIYYEQE